MSPQPRHLRSQGLKTYFIPKERYQARRLQDATTILRLEFENRRLKNELKRMIG